MFKSILKHSVIGIVMLLPTVTCAQESQSKWVDSNSYVPSQLRVWGPPYVIPVPVWDRYTGELLKQRTVKVESRPTFGRVRYGVRNGALVYYPDSTPATPDSFTYSIQDSKGDIVKVKVLIDPRHEAIIVRQRWYF